MVTTSTRQSGSAARSAAVAAIPSRPGISTSSSATSGAVLVTRTLEPRGFELAVSARAAVS